jgi:hypothetical protein
MNLEKTFIVILLSMLLFFVIGCGVKSNQGEPKKNIVTVTELSKNPCAYEGKKVTAVGKIEISKYSVYAKLFDNTDTSNFVYVILSPGKINEALEFQRKNVTVIGRYTCKSVGPMGPDANIKLGAFSVDAKIENLGQ